MVRFRFRSQNNRKPNRKPNRFYINIYCLYCYATQYHSVFTQFLLGINSYMIVTFKLVVICFDSICWKKRSVFMFLLIPSSSFQVSFYAYNLFDEMLMSFIWQRSHKHAYSFAWLPQPVYRVNHLKKSLPSRFKQLIVDNWRWSYL